MLNRDAHYDDDEAFAAALLDEVDAEAAAGSDPGPADDDDDAGFTTPGWFDASRPPVAVFRDTTPDDLVED